MAFIADAILDNGLAYLATNGGRLDICSQEPTSYAEATSTYTLGNKSDPTIAAAADAAPNGRGCAVSAITDGSVTGTGTATHFAITKTTATTALLVTGALGSSQAVTSGNTFTLTGFTVRIPDAA